MRKMKKINKEDKNTLIHSETRLEYSGIIPPPAIIEGYERNCPGATDRILAMAEEELINKRILETKEQENIREIIRERKGQWELNKDCYKKIC